MLHLIRLVLLLLLSQGPVLGQRPLTPTTGVVLKVPEVVRGCLSPLLPGCMISRGIHVRIYHRLVKLNEFTWVCEGLPTRDRTLLISESMSSVIAAKLLPILILLIEDTGDDEVLPCARGREERSMLKYRLSWHQMHHLLVCPESVLFLIYDLKLFNQLLLLGRELRLGCYHHALIVRVMMRALKPVRHIFHLALRPRKHEPYSIPSRCHGIVVLRLLLKWIHPSNFNDFTLQRESYFLFKIVLGRLDGGVLLR